MLAAVKAALTAPGIRHITESWDVPPSEQSVYALRILGTSSSIQATAVLTGSEPVGRQSHLALSSDPLPLVATLSSPVEPIVSLPELEGFKLLPTDTFRNIPTVVGPLTAITIQITPSAESSEQHWRIFSLEVEDLTAGRCYKAVLPETGASLDVVASSIRLRLKQIPFDGCTAAREAEEQESWKVAHAAELLPLPI